MIMIIAAIIVGIILLILIFLTFYMSNRNDSNLNSAFDCGVTPGVVITTFIFIEGILISIIISDPYPTAMDVYQGKTTLEYKVVDGVKVDSVVIFKKQ